MFFQIGDYTVNLEVWNIEQEILDSAPSSNKDNEALLCKVAFVMKNSDLVKNHFKKENSTAEYKDSVAVFGLLLIFLRDLTHPS